MRKKPYSINWFAAFKRKVLFKYRIIKGAKKWNQWIDSYKASFISGYAATLCFLKLSSLHDKTLRLKIKFWNFTISQNFMGLDSSGNRRFDEIKDKLSAESWVCLLFYWFCYFPTQSLFKYCIIKGTKKGNQ